MSFPRLLLFWPLLWATSLGAVPPVPEDPFALTSGQAESDAPAEKLPVALARAVALSSLVEDEEFQSRLKLDLVEFQLTKGFSEAALRVAKTIPGYRRGIAIAWVVAARARKGQRNDLEQWLDEALNKTGFPDHWQREAIQAEAAISWVAAGEDARGAALAEKLSEYGTKLRARAGMAVEQARSGVRYDPAVFEAPQEIAKLAPELLHLVRGAIEIAELRLAAGPESNDEVGRLCAQSERIVLACKASAGEELLDLGILLRKIGETKKGAEVLTLALRHLPPGVEMQGWKAGYFARLVSLYVASGKEERVSTLLEMGRKGIPPLHAFYQPLAFCQLAEAELVAGRPAQAEKTWAEAVAVALANSNPSSRFLGAAQVVFSIARTGLELPESIAAQLDTFAPAGPSATAEK